MQFSKHLKDALIQERRRIHEEMMQMQKDLGTIDRLLGPAEPKPVPAVENGRLTEAAVRNIRTTWKARKSQTTQTEFCDTWAEKLGVSRATVRNALVGVTFAHI